MDNPRNFPVDGSRQWPPETETDNRAKRKAHDTSRPRIRTKPDPSAEKITPPCSECGRRFWSWKALFGHMRCHPERHWRGINPPASVDYRRRQLRFDAVVDESEFTDTEREVAAYLILLAEGPPLLPAADSGGGRFECSGCKKVFGSHQALGGHRASHKNVMGCFAMRKADGAELAAEEIVMLGSVPTCKVCTRAFGSCEALDVHMYSHRGGSCSSNGDGCCDLDLNLTPPIVEGGGKGVLGMGLDLKLGI